MLLLSTALYIAETQKNLLKYNLGSDLSLPFYKQGLRHTMISALANISNGGNANVLEADLNQFNAFIANHSYDAFFKLEFALLNTAPYQNGVWISQNSSGKGTASAFVNFSLNSSGTSETYHSEYEMNITSMIETSGYYVLNGTERQVNLTCKVSNEGKPALAKSLAFSYERDGLLDFEEWILVTAPDITDCGNGTYLISFNAVTDHPDDPLLVWVSCQDQRNILVQTQMALSLK